MVLVQYTAVFHGNRILFFSFFPSISFFLSFIFFFFCMTSLPCPKQTTNLQVNKALQSVAKRHSDALWICIFCRQQDHTVPRRMKATYNNCNHALWMKHRRPATVRFIMIYLTCLDLSYAYSFLCHSRRWDIMFDVFADLATTFLLHSLQVSSLSSFMDPSGCFGLPKNSQTNEQSRLAWG